MAGRGSAALKKRAQTLAAKGDDSMIELAEALSELRALGRYPGEEGRCVHPQAEREKIADVCALVANLHLQTCATVVRQPTRA